VQKGSRAQIVDASLRRLYLWEYMHQLKLVRNMRVQNDPWFAVYLLRIDEGRRLLTVMATFVYHEGRRLLTVMATFVYQMKFVCHTKEVAKHLIH
jgi:hypothetical protein